MTDQHSTSENVASFRLAPFSSPLPIEFTAYYLAPIAQAHPEHVEVIDKLCYGANPPSTWGLVSSAALLGLDYCETTAQEQLDGGFWAFAGETVEQRDQRVMEDFKAEMLQYAAAYGGTEELLQILRELKSAYYLVTYSEDGPASKVLKQAST